MSNFASELQTINQALRQQGWAFRGYRLGQGYVAQRPDGTQVSAGTPTGLLQVVQRYQQQGA
jgi:hypothetical protein